jgi:hypothetical protein
MYQFMITKIENLNQIIYNFNSVLKRIKFAILKAILSV